MQQNKYMQFYVRYCTVAIVQVCNLCNNVPYIVAKVVVKVYNTYLQQMTIYQELSHVGTQIIVLIGLKS